jgi:hypothetical protein
MPELAYDYALKLLIDASMNDSVAGSWPHDIHSSLEATHIWKFIYRNYLPSKLIINCSTPSDIDMDIDALYKKYKFAILHKKHRRNVFGTKICMTMNCPS